MLPIIGTKVHDRTVNLHIGWNLIPVFSDCEFPTNQLFLQGNFEIIKEVAGSKVFWPMKQIGTLETIKPGQAYLIFMISEGTVTFPDCE